MAGGGWRVAGDPMIGYHKSRAEGWCCHQTLADCLALRVVWRYHVSPLAEWALIEQASRMELV